MRSIFLFATCVLLSLSAPVERTKRNVTDFFSTINTGDSDMSKTLATWAQDAWNSRSGWNGDSGGQTNNGQDTEESTGDSDVADQLFAWAKDAWNSRAGGNGDESREFMDTYGEGQTDNGQDTDESTGGSNVANTVGTYINENSGVGWHRNGEYGEKMPADSYNGGHTNNGQYTDESMEQQDQFIGSAGGNHNSYSNYNNNGLTMNNGLGPDSSRIGPAVSTDMLSNGNGYNNNYNSNFDDPNYINNFPESYKGSRPRVGSAMEGEY